MGATTAGIGKPAARVEVRPEAAHALGEDLDVALAAPLAVRDLVEACALLEADGGVDGRVEEPVGLRLGEPARLPVKDDVPDPGRAGQAADDGRGEEATGHEGKAVPAGD